MKVLLTGGAGFIGTNLSKKLLSLGHEVFVLDNFITSNNKNILPLLDNLKFRFIRHDIVNPIPSSVPRIAQIYHLACPTGVPNLEIMAEEMLLTCSLGTRNILEFARLCQAKIVFTSSSEVYGDPQIVPQDERYTGNVDPVGWRSPYEEGKRFAESLLKMYVNKYKMSGKIVRIFNTYGPGSSDKDSRVIPRFLRLATSNQTLTIYGNGLQKRTFCFVDDLVHGLILIMEKGRDGEVYNLGSDKQITIKDLARKILKLTKSKSKIIFTKSKIPDHKSRLPSLTKVKKLGFKLKTPLEEGLKLTLSI